MRIFIFALILLASCKIDSDRAVDRENFTFKTGDDTELFFKNVRQSYYDLEENKAAKFNVFRFEERSIDESKPILNLAIVINYLKDEAYLLIEPNKALTNEDAIIVIDETSNESIVLQNFNHASMLEFASKIYEGLLQNHDFLVDANGKTVPLLDSKTEREAFRITVSDYYRLTRVY